MAPGRKVPFSAKAKKEQLKAKRARKQQFEKRDGKVNLPFLRKGRGDEEDDSEEYDRSTKINYQPGTSKSKQGRDVNRYALQFYKESKEELAKMREQARSTLVPVAETDMEIKFEYYFPPELDFPKRPPWNFDMSRDELDAREHKYFTEYVKRIENEFGAENLSYFELNLETWRQLWRVLEMSDIVLIIVDVRYAALMFPPSVYKFVVEECKKDMILVLNKIDLVTADVVVAWKHYFLKHYPTLKIITFTSFPSYNLRNIPTENKTGLQVRRRRGKLRMAAEGAQRLYEACKEITQNQVNLTSWSEKISEEMDSTYDDDEDVERNVVTEAADTGYEEHEKYKGGVLTIGCIGQPNVGKSSLMNAIMGKKVVSVSRTPGHTKHFQTIYLTQNVRLCDCPGLVFPSKIPRTLQILIGAYPIAQVREPYSAVKFLAERLDLPKLLGIQHPENDDTWSAMDVCDGWAKKRGFYTAKAARLDSYRAANNILRMALEGKICLTFKPPDYYANQEYWKKHPDVTEIAWIQAKEKTEAIKEIQEEVIISSDEEEKGKTDQQREKDSDSDDEGDDDEDEEEEEEDDAYQAPSNKFELLNTTED